MRFVRFEKFVGRSARFSNARGVELVDRRQIFVDESVRLERIYPGAVLFPGTQIGSTSHQSWIKDQVGNGIAWLQDIVDHLFFSTELRLLGCRRPNLPAVS